MELPEDVPELGEYHFALELVAGHHDPHIALPFYITRILQRPLLLRPSTEEDQREDIRTTRQLKRARRAEAHAKRKSKKPKPLSAKEKRAFGVHEIPKEEQKYAIYEPLHRMWLGYIREILGLDGSVVQGYGGYVMAKGAGPLLASADYHGALLEVVRSRCVSRVGLRGIVVKDTKFTYEMITPKNELKVVPKEHTIFRFEIPLRDDNTEGENEQEESKEGQEQKQKKTLIFELHGTAFENRAAERATKRVKLHLSSDL